jgi:hypothetical protein
MKVSSNTVQLLRGLALLNQTPKNTKQKTPNIPSRLRHERPRDLEVTGGPADYYSGSQITGSIEHRHYTLETLVVYIIHSSSEETIVWH